ncbi:hypothetical protein CKA32_000658 [Geitlerinema sp. FC II]|nr:hypothetical protein CKA32_000658 [Geitlerinema sp. FC II]
MGFSTFSQPAKDRVVGLEFQSLEGIFGFFNLKAVKPRSCNPCFNP